MNRVQLLLDKYYHTAHDKIWADERLSDEQKLEATDRAHDKAWARIERETGYLLRNRNANH